MLTFILQVTGECNKAEQWFREKTQQQDSLPKNADPILLSSEIKRKVEALEGYVSELIYMHKFIRFMDHCQLLYNLSVYI